MGRRRALKGVAAGTATFFVSRNNDFDGYWVVGKLHSYATEHSITKILIDLSGDLPESLSKFASIASRYRSKIETQAAIQGLTIHSSQIEVELGLPRTSRCLSDETGFVCTVTIVDDRGRAWTHNASGCSRPHDPKRELRSSRVEGEAKPK